MVRSLKQHVRSTISAMALWVRRMKNRFLSVFANARSGRFGAGLPVKNAKLVGLERKPECCIGYFGLNRSLHKTGRNIAQNVRGALTESFAVSSIAHFNCPSTINSPRAGELNVAAQNFNTQGLDCELTWLEPQQQVKIEHLIPLVMNFPMKDEPDPDGIIRKNALFQMYSQSKLLQMLRMLGMERFKLFCLARADLLYLDPIPAASMASIVSGKVDLVTPAWQRWGGFNDRFALCSRAGAEIYLDRINWVSRFCQEKGYFHPEEILRFSVEQSGATFDFMPTRARRVRSTGVANNEDFTIEG